jgi:hypothetical protein
MEPKIRRAPQPRGAARGRRTRRRSESVGTDSRVLRPAEAADTPADASGAKYFSHCEIADVGGNRCAKLRASEAARARACDNGENHDVAETRSSQAFLRYRVFVRKRARAK